jgi:hypothetical protein
MSTNTPRPLPYGPEKRRRLKDQVLGRLVFSTIPDELNAVDHFAAILDRVEQHGLGIHGIDVGSEEEGELFTETFEQSGCEACTEPRWYRTAFQEMKNALGHIPGLWFSATYYVPEELIEAEAVREREEERERSRKAP